jgi:glycine/D-amino acid oxidase-like deaminating enzyme
VPEFKKEAKVAAGLGLPASFETNSPLPFKIKAAVKFADQAHFSAQKYIEALAQKIDGNGSFIYEQSRAIWFNDGPICSVKTPNGKVHANSVIIATNVPTAPLLARGSYCIREYPNTSYLIAGRSVPKFKGMYISPDNDNYSILPVGSGDKQILLVGGDGHIRGVSTAGKHYRRLADYAHEKFGFKEVEYKWKAWDYIAYDGIPLVGKLYRRSENLYVATAFKKWGLAHSMVAGTILRDLITGQKNPWADIYTPHRTSPMTSIPHVIAKSFR